MTSDDQHTRSAPDDSRREFIRGSSLWLASALPSQVGRGQIRVGLLGCGRRGIRSVSEAFAHAPERVRLVAMADAHGDRLQQAARALKGKSRKCFLVQPETRFIGMSAYRRLVDCDLDLVVVATPPAFRAKHISSAIAATRHVFVQQPIAINIADVATIMDAERRAIKHGLNLAIENPSMTANHQQAVQLLRQGILGEIDSIRHLCKTFAPTNRQHKRYRSPQELDLRNWRGVPALGGGTMPQHAQALDFALALFSDGSGSRFADRCGVSSLEAFENSGIKVAKLTNDSIQYVLPNGVRLDSVCTAGSSGTYVYGERGYYEVSKNRIVRDDGEKTQLRRPQPAPSGIVQLVAAISSGQPRLGVAEAPLSAYWASRGCAVETDSRPRSRRSGDTSA